MRVDPFVIKQYPKWHPRRLLFTAQARLAEWEARQNFNKYALPEKLISSLPTLAIADPLDSDIRDSQIHSYQMPYLLHGLAATEHLSDTVVLEVGCYRGGTTRTLAQATSRKVVAIDPYIGYGGGTEDYQHFLKNTQDLPNITHTKLTSGEAAQNWQYPPASFVLIDALHDYVNTAFDFEVWSALTLQGGILAMHDTDCLDFAGTRKAVFEVAKDYELIANPAGLTLLRKIN